MAKNQQQHDKRDASEKAQALSDFIWTDPSIEALDAYLMTNPIDALTLLEF